MTYNSGTRNELYDRFRKNHMPGGLFNILSVTDNKEMAEIFTTNRYLLTDEQKEKYEIVRTSVEGYTDTPEVFFRTRYPRLVKFCAGSSSEADILYPYLAKLNRFPYTSGWSRRTIRTKTYMDPVSKVRDILYTSYNLQIYDTTLDKYLLNELSEELLDYKEHQTSMNGLEDIIAAHLDAGDIDVKNAIEEIINGENNTSFITTDIIRGILKSDDKDMHELLGKLLLAARLQEGVRQAICENMDCGTIEAFRTLFDVIDQNDLLRFSAVRRAVATWIGVIDPESLTRSSDKTFSLMREVVHDDTCNDCAERLVNSNDAIEIMVGLWGYGIHEVNNALSIMEKFVENHMIQGMRVATYYSRGIQLVSVMNQFTSRIIESPDLTLELAAEVMPIYLDDYRNEAARAAGLHWNRHDEPRSVNLKLWFSDEATARKHVAALFKVLSNMGKKKIEFDPAIFPWYSVTLTKSDILLRICTIANGLGDDEILDQLAEKLTEFDGADGSRGLATGLLFTGNLTPVRKACLIEALGDKESLTRKNAFRIAQNIRFTPEEYDRMCSHLRLKNSELRVNIINLIRNQDATGIIRSLRNLIGNKNEEMHLAGLDIIRGLIDSRKRESSEFDEAIEIGKSLAKSIEAPTDREKISIKEILRNEPEYTDSNHAEDAEHSNNTIELTPVIWPDVTFNNADYPLLRITSERLEELFTKLDALIDENSDYEYRACYGEKVLLGNEQRLISMTYGGSVEERYPLIPVWRGFYESEINSQDELMAMFLALKPSGLSRSRSMAAAQNDENNKFIHDLTVELYGEPVASYYKHHRNSSRYYFHDDIVGILKNLCMDASYLQDFGAKVLKYLCKNVPSDKKLMETESYGACKSFKSPICQGIISEGCIGFATEYTDVNQFISRFNLLGKMNEELLSSAENSEEVDIVGLNRNLVLNAVDYVQASFYGLISEEQLLYFIFNVGKFKSNLTSLFLIYAAEKRPAIKARIMRNKLLEDEALISYWKDIANRVATHIVNVECRRGDSNTEYSRAVSAIEFFYGANHLVSLLRALGKEKLVRRGAWGFGANTSKNATLSHLIGVCHPWPEDTVDTFREAMDGSNISDKRLIEVAMYAPQWIDIIEQYLDFKGLRTGVYYFMAHMNDEYNRDERKFAEIARFTPLEKEELFNGAFDIDWFTDAYQELGDKRFSMLYDAAKYISDGSRHTRARKYSDATLGKITVDALESEISEKRNKDLLMSYPLIPLGNDDDLLRRYKFIQKFRKESTQFGAQRRASEGIACDMAMRNLATRAGYQDVTRLTLQMETALTESLSGYFEWRQLESKKSDELVEVCIQLGNDGKPAVLARKNGKQLASIPSAYKKDPYVIQLKDSNKIFREQYSRAVKMFEKSMEEREVYRLEEMVNLLANPVIRPIIGSLVFCNVENHACGLLRTDGSAGLINVSEDAITLDSSSKVIIAHPYDLYENGTWRDWQKCFFKKQKEEGIKQHFRQVFRELYVKLDEELEQYYSRQFAGYQIQPSKATQILKSRGWIADPEDGLEKIFYKNNIVVNMYALADWFSPSDIEPAVLEYVTFADRKTAELITIEAIPDVIYSEAMRDVDLAVSVAHAGGVDPETTHSTIEMRRVIAECNIDLFNLKNVHLEGTHALISGSLADYTVHLGSGVVHMRGSHQLNVLPVHSQHRGKVFLPFLDSDPKTAEIISKILLFSNDKKIKDPYILSQIKK